MRVVLADDAALFRESLAAALREADFDVVGQCSTADELTATVRATSPDVAVVDVRMPPTQTDEGLRAAAAIRAANADVGLLVLSQYAEVGVALELLLENAAGIGYLLKDRVANVEELAEAVRRVGGGGSVLDPSVVAALVARRRGDDPLDGLTPREREVLELVAEGRSNRAIAEHLHVSERAVKKHITNIFEKLRLPSLENDHRRVLAVLAFLRTH